MSLVRLSRAIDGFTSWVGRLSSYGLVAAIFISAGNAVARRFFSVSSNAWLEVQWYLFGFSFLCCAAWVLARDEHTRIDVIAAHFSARTRRAIDLFGHVFFLAPVTLLLIGLAVPYFWHSFVQGEHSANAGGLPLWPAKLIILAGFALLALQCISQMIKVVVLKRGPEITAEAAAVEEHHP